MNIPKELQELRANIEALIKNYEEVRAMPPGEMDKDMDKDKDHNKTEMENKMRDMMMDMMSYTHSRISYLEDEFYTHARGGHLPAVKSPSQMEHCLEVLGLGGDYQVRKPMISTAREKYGFEVK